MSTGIIILAAGNSSRLGKPKQLLTYQGKTLLQIVCDEALKTTYKPVIVVLGAYSDTILEQQSQEGITCIINERWQDGMSSSISAGILALLNSQPDIQNVIIAVADQVFITHAIFEKLVAQRELNGKSMVASSYAQTIGSPVLFNKKYFHQLLSLTGNHGAKHILKQHPDDIDTIAFELGHIDIDTETDYTNLIHNK
ncbi:nucleotidyltransferase family protein [Pedobacter metabolipauper]|uniref:Molybdenum cofactor cytidylyltransferase n=1 Tax=Pedobacter metabolipauper TaxID=425513 RepID=A0A4R6SZ49_9SPHI|nr:nucleotidyltransferase family protein [Pedobacter metabolipauper]TDQ11049.1 molybdenum cofactor cytidylyltransferase [Pedobacter metabolipauper]